MEYLKSNFSYEFFSTKCLAFREYLGVLWNLCYCCCDFFEYSLRGRETSTKTKVSWTIYPDNFIPIGISNLK